MTPSPRFPLGADASRTDWSREPPPPNQNAVNGRAKAARPWPLHNGGRAFLQGAEIKQAKYIGSSCPLEPDVQNHLNIATGLPDLDALWDFDRPEVTERTFRDLLALASAADHEAYQLELLTQIARAQGLQGRYDEALVALDQVEARLPESAPRVRVRYLLERGRVLNSSGSPAEASPLFHEVWELATARGEDALAVDAAHMLGIVAPPPEQLAWNVRALDLAERSADPGAQRWRGSLLNNIGWTYHDAGRYEEALETFQQALAWHERVGRPRETEIARWSVGRTLRSLGRLQEALVVQRDLLAELDARGESDGYAHEELAECLLALGHAHEARLHFAAAYAALSSDPWLVDHEQKRLERLDMLATGER